MASVRDKVLKALYDLVPQLHPQLYLLWLSPAFTLLQSQWPLPHSSNTPGTPAPQSHSTCCSQSLKCPSIKYLHDFLITSFWLLFKCYLSRKSYFYLQTCHIIAFLFFSFGTIILCAIYFAYLVCCLYPILELKFYEGRLFLSVLLMFITAHSISRPCLSHRSSRNT